MSSTEPDGSIYDDEITHSLGGWTVHAKFSLRCAGPCPAMVPVRALLFQNPRAGGRELSEGNSLDGFPTGGSSEIMLVIPGEWETPPGRPARPHGQITLEVASSGCNGSTKKSELAISRLAGDDLLLDLGELRIVCGASGAN